MKIALPRYTTERSKFLGIKYSFKVKKEIDTFCFTSRYILNHTYMSYWERPDKTIYIKFTSCYPRNYYDYRTGKLPIGGMNSYNHKLLKVENCYVIG